MDNQRNANIFIGIGIGITLGVIGTWFLIFVIGAKPHVINAGPIEFELTTPIIETKSAIPMVQPLESSSVMSETKLLGLWLYQQSRLPMPTPASSNQVIFAHGDIDNTGTCHVKEFGPGEPIQGLGLGSFKLWLITGTAEYIKDVENQLQNGAAVHAGSDCPYLP